MKTFNKITLLTLAIMRMCLTVVLVMVGGVWRVLEFAFQGWASLLELVGMFLETVIEWIADCDEEEEEL